ncbi:MAG: hypothetical protein JW947_06435 [Sedimentisphaerales bacterium]|nr:hypothetical protein [Sedimentisphaerales bacterium]
MPVRSKINRLFGFIAGGFLVMFGRTQAKPDSETLRQMEFKTSTQRLGVRFTEKVRDVFRFKWLRKF